MIACPGRGSLLSPTLAKLQMSFPTGSSNTLVRVRKLFSQWRFKAPLHCTALHSHAQPPSFLTWWGLGEHSARPGVEAACLVFTLAHSECHDNQTTSIGEKHCRHSWLLQGSCAKQEVAPHFGRSIIWEDQDLYDHVWSIRVSFLPHPRATGLLLCRQIWRAMQGCLWRGDKTSQRDAKGDIATGEAGFLWHTVIQMIQDRYTLLWQWYMTITYDNTNWDIWFLHILTYSYITCHYIILGRKQ